MLTGVASDGCDVSTVAVTNGELSLIAYGPLVWSATLGSHGHALVIKRSALSEVLMHGCDEVHRI